MATRRTLLGLGGLGLLGGLVSARGGGSSLPSGVLAPEPSFEVVWRMPDEGDIHRAIWMAFAARESIWTAEMRQPVHQALARIANAISVYEPVKMLVNAADFATARQLCGANVQLIERPIDDLWMRDTGCVFVRNARGERGVLSSNPIFFRRLRLAGRLTLSSERCRLSGWLPSITGPSAGISRYLRQERDGTAEFAGLQ